ncbi:TBC1 domain family member 10A isoform X2 [Scleropages formosus]|uniref:Si:ch211-266k8.4 n=1 Tax=Scleropages formosus TaxID=113540 RepID=A0A8C9V8S6_SCLFO|nr:TBC1 domain family member 10A-like isoform X2 [Scleropages formosus]
MRRRSSGSAARRRTESSGFDEFGFALRGEQRLQGRCHQYSYPQPNSAEAKELRGLISCWDGSSVTCRNQIEHFMKMGIPPVLRGRVWRCLLDIDTLRATSKFCYQACSVSTDDLVILHQIALDLRRSFPTHRSLMGDTPEAIEGQAKLFRVLVAYARYNPKIGYSQGMSHIGAVLLMNLPEEEAFWALVALLESPKYLSGLFDHSLDKIQHQVGVFHQLLKHRSPRLFQHIEDVGVSSLHYAMPWFLSVFTSLPCWDSVMAIWDLVMLHGMLALFRVGLTIIHLLEPQLLRMKDEALVLPLLLHVPVDVAQHCILIPALWNTEVQEWEVICMNSLILEEAGDGSCHLGQVAESPSAIKTRSRKKLDLEEGLKEAAAGRAKSAKTARWTVKTSILRILKNARRYLGNSVHGQGEDSQTRLTSHANPSLSDSCKTRPASLLTRAQGADSSATPKE